MVKKTEELNPDLVQEIADLRAPHSQSECKHRDTVAYVKLSISWIRARLVENRPASFKLSHTTLYHMLNRWGYSLKRVLKCKPLKRIADTEAIFENVLTARKAPAKADTLRISMDVKDKVKIGELSRGGKHRGKQALKALDKDQHWQGVLIPFGVLEIDSGQSTVIYGNSWETSDFLVDALEK